MNHKPFSANSWLQLQQLDHTPSQARVTGKSYNEAPDELSELVSEFRASDFLIPDWKGESLISKSALHVKKLQDSLWQDAINQFKNIPGFNKSMKISIHQDFLSYISFHDLNLNKVDNFNTFWQEIYRDDSQYRQVFDDYITIFCFRSVTIYLYKIKFIMALGEGVLINISDYNLLHPNSFFTKVFKRGSSKELVCESLQSNMYSWYHPSSHFLENVSQSERYFQNLTVTELMKLSINRYLEDRDCATPVPECKFSHSLSHKSFGQFINMLLIYMPIWKHKEKFSYPQPMKDNYPQVMNTKFIGDYLTSLSHSHWLAQEYHSHLKWSEILCPDFTSDSFETGNFTKYCHELKFLNFLVEYSRNHNEDPIDFISATIREKYKRSKEVVTGQPSLFSHYDLKSELVYERIILNIHDLPKKNPHHFLVAQINQQKKSLDKKGQLIVLSNQKLFVPSQSLRVEQLLQDFKLEAHFNFEELKGKGEIPNYIYIFTKKSEVAEDNNLFFGPFGNPMSKAADDSSFSTFRWTGELSLFNKFELFVSELNKFFHEKTCTSTPLFQSEVENDLCFEYHQDAVLEGGILLSSTSKDSSRITHPIFFKNLTKSCSPLDYFFNVEQLSVDTGSNTKKSITTELLGISFQQEEQYPLVLIVDYSNTAHIKLELTTSESYKAKYEKYGQAFYQYFGLLPKIQNLNVNLFREYFSTNIGQQIIQLSLQGGITKLKSKLKALLIPNFFEKATDLPHFVKSGSDIFKLTSEELLELHPNVMVEEWDKYKGLLSSSSRDYPWAIMSVLSNFKFHVEKAFNSVTRKCGGNTTLNYNNPLIITPLLKLRSYPIYPKNEEIYVDFNIKTIQDLKQPLQYLNLTNDENGYALELQTNDKVVVARLYSEPELLKFIRFLLESALGHTISDLLGKLSVPKLEELKHVLGNFEMMEVCFNQLRSESNTLIDQILTKQITQSLSDR